MHDVDYNLPNDPEEPIVAGEEAPVQAPACWVSNFLRRDVASTHLSELNMKIHVFLLVKP